MKALKITALVMSALLLVMVLMMAYLFMTAEVTAQVVSSVGVSAAEQEGYFSSLKKSVEEDTFIGTLYQKPTQWKERLITSTCNFPSTSTTAVWCPST